MFTIAVTPTGFVRDRLDVIKANLEARAKTIFGDDIELGEETPDGQLIGAFAEALDDTAQAVEDTYNGRNPAAATGQNLTSTCLLNGVFKILGDYSFVDVLVTIPNGALVSSGAQVRDQDNGAVYATVADATGTGSPQLITCKALVKGTVSAAGKVTQIVTPTYGFSEITNPLASTTVAPEEHDEALRMRRSQSTGSPSQGMIESALAGLLAVPAVGFLRLWENDTDDTIDAKTGDKALPPHSLTAVTTGGEASAIGAALYSRKGIGCSTKGSSSVVVSDSAGNPHTMHYTVATPVDFAVRITYKERSGQGFGGDGGELAVQNFLAAWVAANQLPGADVLRFHLAIPAQQAVLGLDGLPAMVIESIQLGRNSGSLADSDLELAWNELGALLPSNVAMVVAS